MRRLAVRALAAAALFATPASSAYAQAWLEPVALSGAAATGLAVATGSNGDTVAVWKEGEPLKARVRAPGGAFAAEQILNGAGDAPDVAVADDGTAVAVWRQGAVVYAATRAPGGAFGTPVMLSSEGAAPSPPQVVMNGRGDALVTYARTNAFAVYKPFDGAWGPAENLSPATGCDVRGALGFGGHAAVVWHDNCAGSGRVRVARRSPGETTFQASQVIPEPEVGDAPDVAVDPDGTTLAVWTGGTAIRAAVAPPGSTTALSAPVNASAGGTNAAPDAAAAAGEFWVAWRNTNEGGTRIAAARKPAGAAFAAPVAISGDGVGAAGPFLSSAVNGASAAAWQREGVVEAAHRKPGGGWAAAIPISGPGAEAAPTDLAGDPDGNVVVGYLRAGAPVSHVLDNAGPRLLGIEMRTTGFALEPYPFTVSPADAWSAVTSTAFDFGDGTPAVAGPAATHSFPAPAAQRTVTITGTDSVGNVSAAVRPFDVLPPLDRTAPVLTDVKLDAKRFRVSGRETAIAAATRRGTRFRYTLSEPAQAVIYFERELGGRRRGSTCRRSRRGMTGKRCKFYSPIGLITRTHPLAGKVSVGFTGRLVARNGLLKVVDKRLVPGRYRATIVAADALRNVSKPVQIGFTVAR